MHAALAIVNCEIVSHMDRIDEAFGAIRFDQLTSVVFGAPDIERSIGLVMRPPAVVLLPELLRAVCVSWTLLLLPSKIARVRDPDRVLSY